MWESVTSARRTCPQTPDMLGFPFGRRGAGPERSTLLPRARWPPCPPAIKGTRQKMPIAAATAIIEFNRVLTSILLYSISFRPLNARYVRFSAAFESSEMMGADHKEAQKSQNFPRSLSAFCPSFWPFLFAFVAYIPAL